MLQKIVHQCRVCQEIKSNASNLRNHALNHFKEPLLKLLPTSKPFKCPICNNPNRDQTTLLRHFAFSHKMVFEYATEDDFKAKCLEKKKPKGPPPNVEIKKNPEPEIEILEVENKNIAVEDGSQDKYRAIALGIRPRNKSSSDFSKIIPGNFELLDQEEPIITHDHDLKAKCLEKKPKGPVVQLKHVKIPEQILEVENIEEDHSAGQDEYRSIALGIRPRNKNPGNNVESDQELTPQKKDVFAKVFAGAKTFSKNL